MFLASTKKPKRLLHLSYIGHVRAEDLERSRDELAALLAELPAGFHLLTDFGRLESMDLACETELGRIMELCDRKGVGMLVRVVPEPRKDIGLNILTLFHYKHRVHAVTCESMEEAARLLSL
jgi:hypothetical protein